MATAKEKQVTMLIAFVLISCLTIWSKVPYSQIKGWPFDLSHKIIKRPSKRLTNQCPNLLKGMTTGHWLTRPLKDFEQNAIDTYLRQVRGVYHIPPTYQRRDMRCGNVTYEKAPQINVMLFRAICDPKGKTPCCLNNRCETRTVDQCRCPNCYDERQAIHAEYSTWKPSDPRCSVQTFNKSKACVLLEGSSIHFIGDSFIRQLYLAFLTFLNNGQAMKPNAQWDKQKKCLGMLQTTDPKCRHWLILDKALCNGTVRIKYTQIYRSKEYINSKAPVLHSHHHKNKSLAILGVGIHDNFNVRTVTKNFLSPFLNTHRYLGTRPLSKKLNVSQITEDFASIRPISNTSIMDIRNNVSCVHNNQIWPKLIWIGMHAPGVLKSSKFSAQQAEGVQMYNSQIQKLLEPWDVPILETFSFSKGTVSYDGTHYSWGINEMKMQMILTYIKSRSKESPPWL